MKALPMLPLNYTTSDEVRAGISHAYSGVFNPRGLEKIWHGPYGHMLSDIASTYNGHLVAHCQYPLWIPSLQALELKLREDFAEHGIDYDSGLENTDAALVDDGESDSSSEEDSDDDTGDFLAGLDSNEGRERSKRLAKHAAAQPLNEIQKQKNVVKGLRRTRNALFDADLKNYDRRDPNLSLESAISRPDDGAIDEEPDFVLSHVAHFDLPVPQSPQARSHYEHRAGIKVFHHCCPLIVELKPPPPRFSKNILIGLRSRFRSAIKDLMEYCSAYFACNSESRSVVALAGAGPFWKSAVLLRTDVPAFDWRIKELSQAGDPKAEAFYDKFGEGYFILGTIESDEELSRLNRIHIFPMLRDGHYTVVTP